MKISKGTIVRTVMVAAIIINMILKALGRPVIQVNEGDVSAFVEMLISVMVIILSWWKNNSFTQNAISADIYLKNLKDLDDGEE